MRSLVNLGVAQFSSVFASTAVTFVTALWLGPSGRGSLAFMLGVANLVGAVFFGSLHVGAVNGVRRGFESSIRRTLHIGMIGAALAFVSVEVVAAVRLRGDVGFSTPWDLTLAAIGSAGVTFNLVVLRTVQGLGDARAFRKCWLTQSTLYAILAIIGAAHFRKPDIVMYAWLIAIVASTAQGLSKLPTPRGKEVPRPNGWLLRESLIAHAAVLGNQLLYRADSVILGIVSSAANLGVYSVAVPLATLGWIGSEAAALAAFARSGKGSEVESEEGRHLKELLRLNAALCTALGFMSVVVAYLLSHTLLESFQGLTLLVAVMLPGVVVQGQSRILASRMAAESAYRSLLAIGFTSSVMCLAYIPACARWGALGAAATSSTLYCLQGLVVMRLWRSSGFRRVLRSSVQDRTDTRPGDASSRN